jgi:hypothetical protein
MAASRASFHSSPSSKAGPLHGEAAASPSCATPQPPAPTTALSVSARPMLRRRAAGSRSSASQIAAIDSWRSAGALARPRSTARATQPGTSEGAGGGRTVPDRTASVSAGKELESKGSWP